MLRVPSTAGDFLFMVTGLFSASSAKKVGISAF